MYSGGISREVKTNDSRHWDDYILFKSPDLNPFFDLTVKILINRGSITVNGIVIRPGVRGTLYDLIKDTTTDLHWSVQSARSFYIEGGQSYYFNFQPNGQTTGIFLDSLDYNPDSRQYNTSSIVEQTRQGVIQWDNILLIEANPNQLTNGDLEVFRARPEIHRAIAVKAYPLKKGMYKSGGLSKYLGESEKYDNQYKWLYARDNLSFDATFWYYANQ